MQTAFERASPPVHLIDDGIIRPRIGLALMGGGSWGIFTAGVLEEILPHLERIGQITDISATSAGSVNGALVASGLHDGGAYEAVRRIQAGWDKIRRDGWLKQFPHIMTDWALPPEDRWPNFPSAYFNTMAGMQAGLHMMNPLGSSMSTQYISNLVRDMVPDWNSVQNGRAKLSANTVRCHILKGTREHVILNGERLTPDGIAASAALKELGTHHIRDLPNARDAWNELDYTYLDGGYAENPPLSPLVNANITDLVAIILHDHNHTPLKQMKSKGGKLKHDEIHTDIAGLAIDDANRIRLHAIQIDMADGAINGWHLNDSSKMNTDPAFLDAMHAAGCDAGRKWLRDNFPYILEGSTYRPHSAAISQLSASGYHY